MAVALALVGCRATSGTTPLQALSDTDRCLVAFSANEQVAWTRELEDEINELAVTSTEPDHLLVLANGTDYACLDPDGEPVARGVSGCRWPSIEQQTRRHERERQELVRLRALFESSACGAQRFDLDTLRAISDDGRIVAIHSGDHEHVCISTPDQTFVVERPGYLPKGSGLSIVANRYVVLDRLGYFASFRVDMDRVTAGWSLLGDHFCRRPSRAIVVGHLVIYRTCRGLRVLDGRDGRLVATLREPWKRVGPVGAGRRGYMVVARGCR